MAAYPSSPVSYGQTSSGVTSLQNFLISQGYAIPAGATGYFGDQTKTALQKWQTAHGISNSTPGFGTDWGQRSIAAASGTAPSGGDTQFVNPVTAQTIVPQASTTPAYVPPAPAYQPPAPAPYVAPAPTLSNVGPYAQNMTQQEVIDLQKGLIGAGYKIPAVQGGTAQPGFYGDETKAAVAQWQKDNQIPTDASTAGYWGPKSKEKLVSVGGFKPAATQSTVQPGGPRTVGKTPVTMANGITVYKDNQTGEYYDASGGKFSTEAITRAMSQTAGGSPISADTNRTDYPNNSTTNPIPPGIDPDGVGNRGIRNLNEDQLALLYPILKPGTPEYQAAMDKISSAYFDVMQQQMNAQTEQQQQAAAYNWSQLKAYTEKNLNIKLSDNSLQAWDQIQSLSNQFGTQNIQGSGLQQEAMDNYLNKIRRTDASARSASQTDADSKMQDYYTKFATPEQIKAFVEASQENRDKARGWGLIPSDGIQSMAQRRVSMKEKYPNMSDKQIDEGLASIYDTNGFYRSNLYQKYMMGGNIGANNPNISTTTDAEGNQISTNVTASDYGVTDINLARERDREAQVAQQNMDNELKKRQAMGTAPYTGTGASPVIPAGTNNAGVEAAAIAASNLGTNPTNSTTSTPPAATQNPYTFTVLSNGNVKGVNKLTGVTTQGTAEYMKTLGYNA